MPVHAKLVDTLAKDIAGNVLLHGPPGFPKTMLVRMALQRRHGFHKLFGSVHTTENVTYERHTHFLVLDLAQDPRSIVGFLTTLLAQPSVAGQHVLILDNLQSLRKDPAAFRVILERFSRTARIFAITHVLGAVEPPLQSRFTILRVPLPSCSDLSKACAEVGIAAVATRDIESALAVEPPARKILPWRRLFRAQFDPSAAALATASRGFDMSCVAKDLLNMLPKGYDPVVFIEAAARVEHCLALTPTTRPELYFEWLFFEILGGIPGGIPGGPGPQ